MTTLREEVDTLIVIPNDRLLEISDVSISVLDAFRAATRCCSRVSRASPS